MRQVTVMAVTGMNLIAHLNVSSAGRGMGIALPPVEVAAHRSAIHSGARIALFVPQSECEGRGATGAPAAASMPDGFVPRAAVRLVSGRAFCPSGLSNVVWLERGKPISQRLFPAFTTLIIAVLILAGALKG